MKFLLYFSTAIVIYTLAMACQEGSSLASDSTSPPKPFPQIKTFPSKEQLSTPYDCGYVDGLSTSAKFCNPFHLTSDGSRLYVADTYNHVIRKIIIATGAVTTLAGAGGSFGAVDKTGPEARFWAPRGITVDNKGVSVYLTDTGNHTIRKIVLATGAVTTIAGSPGRFGSNDGAGPSARFNEPQGITIDPSGAELYVADTSNHAIRKIEIATGTVTTLAGHSGYLGFEDGIKDHARFDHPAGIAINHSGTHLYVTDSSNQAIRKIKIETGEVTTLAGPSGRFGKPAGKGESLILGFPQGLTLDQTDSALYIADTANHSIRRIDLATEEVSTFTGTPDSSPLLGLPQGILYDHVSNCLYFSDKSTNSIRKLVIPTRNITTLAGPP